MIESFLTVAPQLWPHALLIMLASWMGVRARTMLTATGAGAGLAGIAILTYWFVQNSISPDRHALIPGQLLALLLASAVPLLSAAWAGKLARHWGASVGIGVLIGIGAGLLLLIIMPLIQERLGCWITAICP